MSDFCLGVGGSVSGSADLVRGMDVGVARISWYNEKDRRMLSGSACIRGGTVGTFPVSVKKACCPS